MSRKISVVGADGRHTLSLLARADICEVVLVSPDAAGVADEVVEAVAREGARRRVTGCRRLDGARGSAVVVFARPPAGAELRELSRTAPAAVLVIAAGDVAVECDRALEATAFSRPRVAGVASAAGPGEGAFELAAAVMLDRNHVVRCVARCQGEAGLHGTQAVRARVGARGVTEILGP